MSAIPSLRLSVPVERPVHPGGDYVLYWMIATRRSTDSFALDHALHRARELGKPLLVFEPLRRGYRWASERFHTFVHQGMVDNRAAFEAAGVSYLSYVEPNEDDDKGLLAALAERAALVVTDAYPTYFLPRMVASAASGIDRRFEVVDSLGIVPLAATPKAFTVAHAFRRWIHKNVRPHLDAFPDPDPLRGYDRGPAAVPDLSRWMPSGGQAVDLAIGGPGAVALKGGATAARQQLDAWLHDGLPRYADGRNHPDDDAASGLSPWLHFGHLSAHRLVRAVLDRDGWTPDELADKPSGKREGWWGASPEVEAFLDECITWREVGHVFAHHVPDHDTFDSLPDWAQATLRHHQDDARTVYSLDDLEHARTDDAVWNAAQTQLVRTGVMHNYLRMLWGKKVLHWSADPREAYETLVHLNDRYALDGRDPNSYSGIGWVFGRYDRAWGPEREVFGKVRYMTSANTRRKHDVRSYLERWAPPRAGATGSLPFS